MRWVSQLVVLAALVGLLSRARTLVEDAESSGRVEHTSHYSDGGPREEAVFVDGVREGPCRRWYRDGTLRAEGAFAAGRMEGPWTWYLPDGSVDPERSGIYLRGARVAPPAGGVGSASSSEKR